MDIYEYEGKIYTRNNKKWVDNNHMVVPLYLQNILNTLFYREQDFSSLSYNATKIEGDKAKQSESYTLAIKYYECALEKADSLTQVSVILPRITSCYRKTNQPKKVIDLLSNIKAKYGEEIINIALLTSVAAAYCDLGEPENALRCCRWGYKILKDCNGEQSFELSNVFLRANRMIDPNYSTKDALDDN